MKTKFLLKLSLVILHANMYGQTEKYCDCEKVYLDTNFTGYCAEYLNFRLLPVVNDKPKFKEYYFYLKGQKVNQYTRNYYSKTDRVFIDNEEVAKSDSIILLHGVVTIIDKKGRTFDEFNYNNGFVIKNIVKDRTVFNRKNRGEAIAEVAEYDYTSIPFTKHLTYYKDDGTITHNEYIKFVSGKFIGELTSDVMTFNILENIKIP